MASASAIAAAPVAVARPVATDEARIHAGFGRRLLALLVDAAILAAAVVTIVHGVNAAIGPVFHPFWAPPAPVRVVAEPAVRHSEKQADGSVRDTTVQRETRIFTDGALRIYTVAETSLTGAGGRSTIAHYEDLVAESADVHLRRRLTQALIVLLPFAYFALTEASRRRASPGKRLLGLAVTDLAGRRLGLGRSLFRQLMKCLDLATSGITYVIAAFTDRRQGLHDMLAGTLVVQARGTELRHEESPPWKNSPR